MAVQRIETAPLSEEERWTIEAAGYVEARNGPNPDTSELLTSPMRVVATGPDWIDVET